MAMLSALFLSWCHISSFRFVHDDIGLDGGRLFGDRLWVSVVLKEMGEQASPTLFLLPTGTIVISSSLPVLYFNVLLTVTVYALAAYQGVAMLTTSFCRLICILFLHKPWAQSPHSPPPCPSPPSHTVDSGSGLSNPVNSCELQSQLEAFREYQETADPRQDREPDYDLRSAEVGPHLHHSVSTPSMVSVGEEQVPGSGECSG